MWGGISALAVATGPSLGSLLIDAGGWRWAFFVNLPVALVAAVATRRVRPRVGHRRARSPTSSAWRCSRSPSPRWRWRSPRAATGAGRARGCVGAVRRWPPCSAPAGGAPVGDATGAPAIDLDVFRNRTVALANAATFLYAVGFFGMLLGNVLFLTSVWDYSTLEAGLAITPGPLLVAALSGPSGRLAARIGYGPVLVAGGAHLRRRPALLRRRRRRRAPTTSPTGCPASLLVGLGVALSFPVLSAAAVAGLPQERFGVGGAMNQTARQIGAVLGVAILIAVIGTPTSLDEALSRFQTAWLVGIVASLGSAAISAFHVRPGVVPVPVLVPAEAA